MGLGRAVRNAFLVAVAGVNLTCFNYSQHVVLPEEVLIQQNYRTEAERVAEAWMYCQPYEEKEEIREELEEAVVEETEYGRRYTELRESLDLTGVREEMTDWIYESNGMLGRIFYSQLRIEYFRRPFRAVMKDYYDMSDYDADLKLTFPLMTTRFHEYNHLAAYWSGAKTSEESMHVSRSKIKDDAIHLGREVLAYRLANLATGKRIAEHLRKQREDYPYVERFDDSTIMRLVAQIDTLYALGYSGLEITKEVSMRLDSYWNGRYVAIDDFIRQHEISEDVEPVKRSEDDLKVFQGELKDLVKEFVLRKYEEDATPGEIEAYEGWGYKKEIPAAEGGDIYDEFTCYRE